jgi:hypothetical protein
LHLNCESFVACSLFPIAFRRFCYPNLNVKQLTIRFADDFEENLYALSKRYRSIRNDVQPVIEQIQAGNFLDIAPQIDNAVGAGSPTALNAADNLNKPAPTPRKTPIDIAARSQIKANSSVLLNL